MAVGAAGCAQVERRLLAIPYRHLGPAGRILVDMLRDERGMPPGADADRVCVRCCAAVQPPRPPPPDVAADGSVGWPRAARDSEQRLLAIPYRHLGPAGRILIDMLRDERGMPPGGADNTEEGLCAQCAAADGPDPNISTEAGEAPARAADAQAQRRKRPSYDPDSNSGSVVDMVAYARDRRSPQQ